MPVSSRAPTPRPRPSLNHGPADADDGSSRTALSARERGNEASNPWPKARATGDGDAFSAEGALVTMPRCRPPRASARLRRGGTPGAQALLDQMAGGAVEERHIVVEPRLVVRQSAAPPP